VKASIAVLAGDGVGPEVTREAVRALEAVGERFGHEFVCRTGLIGGAGIDATGSPFPDATRALVAGCDAVLLGAVGGPQWSDPAAPVRPEQGLLALRGVLETFANLRPVRVRASLVDATPFKPAVLEGTDVLFVRELTGGAYFGAKRLEDAGAEGERAVDECAYTTREIERVARVAGSLAAARGGQVTSVDKANVLETSRLWRRTMTRVMRDEYPAVTVDHAYVDSFAMQLVRTPSRFDVVVTENLFGDILTDEAAVLAGSLGLLPSASLAAPRAAGRCRGLYEPVHGSAPDIAGRGIANPAAALLSAAMLLRHSLGLESEARMIEHAVDATLDAGVRTPDLPARGRVASTTREFGDAVMRILPYSCPGPPVA
jgi:3-isopropylmalate dehydrogenase